MLRNFWLLDASSDQLRGRISDPTKDLIGASMFDNTAAGTFFEAADSGDYLPASIPVRVSEGDYPEGLATQLYAARGNPKVEQYVWSDDKNDRAKAAISACYEAAKQVERSYDYVRASVLV